jgi:ParB-like chromosome segregation protein Spo0J
VAIGWTEEAIAVALALSVRQIRKLRQLANVLPAMLKQMALGDMPSEQQLKIIAAASEVEQKEVWKAHKPKKGGTAAWWSMANALTKKRVYAKDASFGDDLGIAPELEPRPDHASCIQSWLSVLADDKRAIFQAAAHAQRAVNFLHSLQPAKVPVEQVA